MLLIATILGSFNSYAAQNVEGCSAIATKVLYFKKSEYEIRLISPSTERPYDYGRIATVPSGKQKLIAVIEGQGNRSNSNMTINIGIERTNLSNKKLPFELDLEANYRYLLVAEKIDKTGRNDVSNFKIKVKSKKPFKCSIKQLNTLNTKNNGEKATLSPSIELPKELAYRLGLLTKEISEHFKENGINDNIITVSQPERASSNIGIITYANKKSIQGINVISVSPYSIASQLGIKAGDTILTVNTAKLTQDNAINQLKQIINDSEDENLLEIEVLRNGASKRLSLQYNKINLPSYQLKIQLTD